MSTPKKVLAAVIPFVAAVLVPALAFAQDEGKGASSVNDIKMWAAIGVGIATGLAVLGGGMGQGRAGAAALEGISRNPGAAAKIQTPMILALAFIESLVLFAVGVVFFMMTSFAK
jgi:F-type H+-transporting ATPase subunit c